MYIRPVALEDHAAILALAQRAGIGMTSLPPDAEVLAKKIEKSVKTFAGDIAHEGDASYLFVLVDAPHDAIVGTCGIKAHVGLRQPYYSYKISTITQSSESLDIFARQELLSAVNDYTGATELGSLYLLPEYRRDRLGSFLSRMRLLFIAQFPHLFDERVIAEIRGVNDKKGHAPFYDYVMKSFFKMEFADADYLCATKGLQFIAELMPRYPIYMSLLPPDVREIIGKPYPSSEAAKTMLEGEGMRYNHYVDIFDAGPTLEARREDILTVKKSRIGKIAVISEQVGDDKTPQYMLMTTQLQGLRARLGRLEKVAHEGDDVKISEAAASRLGVGVGDEVRYVEL